MFKYSLQPLHCWPSYASNRAVTPVFYASQSPDMASARCTQVNQWRINDHFGKLMSFVWLLQCKRAPRLMSSRYANVNSCRSAARWRNKWTPEGSNLLAFTKNVLHSGFLLSKASRQFLKWRFSLFRPVLPSCTRTAPPPDQCWSAPTARARRWVGAPVTSSRRAGARQP